MTPTFKCIQDCDLHHAKCGEIIKMSPNSLIEFDLLFPKWRDKYVQLTLEEELLELNKQ